MKTIFYFLVLIFLFSCNNETPLDHLKNSSEKELKLKLHDPYSYEFISFEADTAMRYISLDMAKERVKLINENISKLKLDSLNNRNQLLLLNDELYSANQNVNSYSKNVNEYILKFRAKNSFGGLVMQQIKVIADSNYNFIELKEIN